MAGVIGQGGTSLDVIGVPFDLCGKRPGSALGPAAIRYAGLSETLTSLGMKVFDCGDLAAQGPSTEPRGLRNFAPMLSVVESLRDAVSSSLSAGRTPLVLGGEHTIVAGGISAALDHFGDGLALLWIDAHTDVNSPATSDTGNLHGMPVAALAGIPSGRNGQVDAEWCRLLSSLGPTRLKLERTGWIAIRDVDPGERPNLHGLTLTMHDIDRHGVVASMERVDAWLRAIGASHVWISFDVDALDPILAPGTGTAVRGGLSYREAHLCAELLSESFSAPDCPFRLAGVDLVETNPLADANNATAVMAVEWIASLFGKTILGKSSKEAWV